MDKLKIAFITPEAVPFAKTGGLADISGVLPGVLSQMGHTVRLFMPYYKQVRENFPNLKSLDENYEYLIGDKSHKAQFYFLRDDDIGLEVYFVGNSHFYHRDELYRDSASGKDYNDNLDRFVFFCKAVLDLIQKRNLKTDIYHANDWQTALIPSYIKTKYRDDSFYAGAATVFTIHNMAYQGLFPAEDFDKVSLEKSYFAPEGPFEFWGKLNLMKSAISYADIISTVSPTYAGEIQESSEYGMGLEGVLKGRAGDLYGVLNGVDYSAWSPEKDRLVPHRYFIKNFSGKKKNKLELLHRAGFPVRMEHPLIGMISRLDNQKGFDLIRDIMDEILKFDLQFVLLGTGAPEYHRIFEDYGRKFPDKFKPFLTFDNRLAHLIEAGSDIFLMPSRYEPCGLNQMYSLKYGTVPIVRKTGGLADTVDDFNENTLEGTGFVFKEYTSEALLETIKRAVRIFGRRRVWYKIMKQGMLRDYSWENSAGQYIELYQKALNKVR